MGSNGFFKCLILEICRKVKSFSKLSCCELLFDDLLCYSYACYFLLFRFQLNSKKSKVAQPANVKVSGFSANLLPTHLLNDSNSDNLKDESCILPLSKSLVGGSMNVCKTRILNFIQTERILQGESTFYILSL